MTNSVFLSYRRSAAKWLARAIFQALESEEVDVFFDVESIDEGRFDARIAAQIRARPYFLLVLAPKTLERCRQPDDWLRREITSAIDAARRIIPLVTTEFDRKDVYRYLEPSLADQIAHLNSVTMDHDYWKAAIKKLHSRFLKPIDLPVVPVAFAVAEEAQKGLARVAAEPQVTEQQMLAQKHLEKGWTLIERDEKAAGIEFDKSISLNPDMAAAYAGRAVVLIGAGNLEAARTEFDNAHRLDPAAYRSLIDAARSGDAVRKKGVIGFARSLDQSDAVSVLSSLFDDPNVGEEAVSAMHARSIGPGTSSAKIALDRWEEYQDRHLKE